MIKILLKSREEAEMAVEDMLWKLTRDPEDRELATLGDEGKFYVDPDVDLETLFRIEDHCVWFNADTIGTSRAFEAIFRISQIIEVEIVRIEAISEEEYGNFYVMPLPKSLYPAAQKALDHYYYEVLPKQKDGLREALHCASFERHVNEFIWAFEVKDAADYQKLQQEISAGILSDRRYIFDVDEMWQIRFLQMVDNGHEL